MSPSRCSTHALCPGTPAYMAACMLRAVGLCRAQGAGVGGAPRMQAYCTASYHPCVQHGSCTCSCTSRPAGCRRCCRRARSGWRPPPGAHCTQQATTHKGDPAKHWRQIRNLFSALHVTDRLARTWRRSAPSLAAVQSPAGSSSGSQLALEAHAVAVFGIETNASL